MKKLTRFETIVKRKNLDFASSGTNFYAFLGSRIYCTFDRLVVREDVPVLKRALEEGSKALIHLLPEEEGEPLAVLLTCTPDVAPDRIHVEMIPVDELLASTEQLENELEHARAVLSLYNDYLFDYNAATDHLRVYQPDRKETEFADTTLDRFEEYLLARDKKKHSKEILKFINALRTGTRSFQTEIPGNVLNDEEATLTLIKGACLYHDGEYRSAAGMIHLGSKRTSSRKKIPELDFLTGVLSKSEITEQATNQIDLLKTPNISIAIIDIDYFKSINDRFGHQTGDEVLRKVAAIIDAQVGDSGIVGRIGGDEFMVLFYNAYDMEQTRERLRSIKDMVASAFLGEKFDPPLTLSIGCASFPKDASDYDEVFALADFALYRAKEKGRARYVIYDVQKHGTLEEIQRTKANPRGHNSRSDNLSPEARVCAMLNRHYTGKGVPLNILMDEIAQGFGIERVMLYSGSPLRVVAAGGTRLLPNNILSGTVDYLEDPYIQRKFEDGGECYAIDNTALFEESHPQLFDKLCRQSVLSLFQVRFSDAAGTPSILSLEYVTNRTSWNATLIPCYRLLAKLLSEYTLVTPDNQ